MSNWKSNSKAKLKAASHEKEHNKNLIRNAPEIIDDEIYIKLNSLRRKNLILYWKQFENL